AVPWMRHKPAPVGTRGPASFSARCCRHFTDRSPCPTGPASQFLENQRNGVCRDQPHATDAAEHQLPLPFEVVAHSGYLMPKVAVLGREPSRRCHVAHCLCPPPKRPRTDTRIAN